jgi:hypothetical protein
MERRMHLAGTAVPEPLKWPSIAAASTELRRPRHLHAVSTSASESTSPRRTRLPTLDSRRR